MRTTIELPDAQRAELLRLAAERGEKGYSYIVQEAVAQYLVGERERRKRIQAALRVGGTFSKESADRLRRAVRKIRDTWR